jgi:hypothetical protein
LSTQKLMNHRKVQLFAICGDSKLLHRGAILTRSSATVTGTDLTGGQQPLLSYGQRRSILAGAGNRKYRSGPKTHLNSRCYEIARALRAIFV